MRRTNNCLAIGLLLLSTTSVNAADLPNGRFIDVHVVPNINIQDGQTFELAPRLTADGLELFFARGVTGTGDAEATVDIWVARRENVDEVFGTPEILGPAINTDDGEFLGSVSADGLTLYFSSRNRPGGAGSWDIWTATRASRDAEFENAMNLESLNSELGEGSPYIGRDDLFIFMDRQEVSTDNDLMMATRNSIAEAFGTPQALNGLNTSTEEGGASLSSDELTIFFNDGFFSDPRPGGKGSQDIWYASRTSKNEPFGSPVNFSAINTSSSDSGLMLTADWPLTGSIAYFASDRNGGNTDIHQATWVLTGDYDGQNGVEQADLDLVLLNWGQPGRPMTPEGWVGDPLRGVIDQDELDRVLLNWGSPHNRAPGSRAAGAVPEPSTCGLIITACILATLTLSAKICVNLRTQTGA